MKNIDIFSDGACSGNPGPGGWASILKYNDKEKVISGSDEHTTNNRMELMAVLEALKCLKEPCVVTIHSDSKYFCDAISKGWLFSWIKKGWKKSDNSPVLNPDLWKLLLDELNKHEYKIDWIKGHNGHPENERCDKLAVSEYQKYL